METKQFRQPYTVTVVCPVCHQPHSVTVENEDFIKFTSRRAHAADAFPYLTSDQRELLITGICGACWDKLFKEEE